jgi:hypothetical protein
MLYLIVITRASLSSFQLVIFHLTDPRNFPSDVDFERNCTPDYSCKFRRT